MEAPKNLYLIQHNGLICYQRNNDEDIEYTRTDVFIKKACEWLENHNDYICGSTNGIVRYDMEKLIEDFKQAME